jgi:hypothetical protein
MKSHESSKFANSTGTNLLVLDGFFGLEAIVLF